MATFLLISLFYIYSEGTRIIQITSLLYIMIEKGYGKSLLCIYSKNLFIDFKNQSMKSINF